MNGNIKRNMTKIVVITYSPQTFYTLTDPEDNNKLYEIFLYFFQCFGISEIAWKFTSLFISHTYTSLMKYLSVADNAKDTLLLHVPSSSERQEWGNNRGKMKNKIIGIAKSHSSLAGTFWL